MYTLGIGYSHHSSVTLLKDNEVLLFITEERLNRDKYFAGTPFKALDLVKNYTKHIDCVLAVSGSPIQLAESVEHLNKQGVTVNLRKRVNHLHHHAHAAAGFFMSHFDNATIIVVDGSGSIYKLGSANVRVSETTSIYSGNFPLIQCTNKHFVIGIYDKRPFIYTDEDKNNFRNLFRPIPISVTEQFDIGWKYAKVTGRIGFGVFGEGKTMGLSAYGHTTIPPQLASMENKIKKAYTVQKDLEKVFVDLVSKVKGNNLVLSGGCALNILGNSVIKKNFPNINLYVDPIAADGTISLGIAADYYYSTTKDINKLVFGPYQGPKYSIDKNYIYECARKYSVL